MQPDMPLELLRANSVEMAERLKLLAHPERLLMLCRMAEGEVTVGELVGLTGLSQSAVSQHLARFRDLGLVKVRREGQARHYLLADTRIRQIIAALWTICEENEAAKAGLSTAIAG